ncbi:MAG: GNAT family N-acetyltransferase [Lachnospiraceae bacterium]|nr:GNAT family N-acetyltransferase [Lachnospiraceae bacterium]
MVTDIDAIVRKQFRLDTNCTRAAEEEKIININEACRQEGSRYFGELDPFFRVIIYHGEMYMSADTKILEWCRKKYSLFKPEWFCKYENLRCVNVKLAEYGYEIQDTHVYFLPDRDAQTYEFEMPYKLKWFDRGDISRFKERGSFKHALGYIPDCPDVIAVAAVYDNEEIAAMAGASSDSDMMWQIGIDVKPEYEHRGLAVYLVTMLKDRILELGKVPFYGTSESHTNSMDVAIRSGFIPSFTEVFCHRIP